MDLAARIRPGFDVRRIELARRSLPDIPDRITDVYFLRTLQILKAKGLNPWIRAQVFIRRGPGIVSGIYEALAVLCHYTDFVQNGGRVWALEEGESYDSCETVLLMEGWAQDFVHLETIYLGVISAATTLVNVGVGELDLGGVRRRVQEIVRATQHPIYGRRPVTYFGARHYSWRADGVITRACFDGGAVACSTDAGALVVGDKAVGTIPHVLQAILAADLGEENAVLESTRAFHDVVDPRIPCVALVDYRNREVTDGVAVARELGSALWAERIDTHGGVVAEGGIPDLESPEAAQWRRAGRYLPSPKDPLAKYWYGPGVTISAVYALRRALDEAGFSRCGIFLTSGFAYPEKVRAFTMAEELLGVKLYDGLGVGEVHPGYFATMDVVSVGKDPSTLRDSHKAGRPYRPNPRLLPAIGV